MVAVWLVIVVWGWAGGDACCCELAIVLVVRRSARGGGPLAVHRLDVHDHPSVRLPAGAIKKSFFFRGKSKSRYHRYDSLKQYVCLVSYSYVFVSFAKLVSARIENQPPRCFWYYSTTTRYDLLRTYQVPGIALYLVLFYFIIIKKKNFFSIPFSNFLAALSRSLPLVTKKSTSHIYVAGATPPSPLRFVPSPFYRDAL